MNDTIIIEEFSVSIIRDRKTERMLSEIWHDAAGEEHRTDNDQPAVRRFNCETGIEDSTIWYHHGKMHREGDKPAVIHLNPYTGRLWQEAWYVKGRPWREDPNKPVHIHYDWDSGAIESMDYLVGRRLVNRCPV